MASRRGVSPLAQKLAWHAEAALMRTAWAFCGLLSPQRASALGGALVRRIGPLTRKHRFLLANLRTCFPDWPEARIEATARASWEQLGRVIGEYPHLGRICGDDGDPRVEAVGAERLDALIEAGGAAILVSGHFANWELMGAMASRRGVPLSVVHDPRANPVLEARLAGRRVLLGCAFLPKLASVHAFMGENRRGRSLGLLIDQRHDEGEAIPLFGRPAPTALAPALLAARLGVPFVPTRTIRLPDCRFRIEVEPPIRPRPELGAPRAVARDMMLRLHARFEAWIAEHPEQWLCIKRRWRDPGKGGARGPRAASRQGGAPAEGASIGAALQAQRETTR
jgi:KDO2-lipid IV(A) lauroyltransferase